MVDVIKSLDFDYICANPGSSFRGLHESFINYGGNSAPELITCCHEESSVAMAHAYFKARGQAAGGDGARHGRPAARLDGDLQRVVRPRAGVHDHRQPRRCGPAPRRRVVPRRAGRGARWCATTRSGTTRRGRSAHFAESAVRAYKIALTPPMAPVVLVLDGGLQEHPVSEGRPRSRSRSSRCPCRRRASRPPSKKPRGCSSPPRTRCSSPIASRARRTA